jgi:hypothetical protein
LHFLGIQHNNYVGLTIPKDESHHPQKIQIEALSAKALEHQRYYHSESFLSVCDHFHRGAIVEWMFEEGGLRPKSKQSVIAVKEKKKN